MHFEFEFDTDHLSGPVVPGLGFLVPLKGNLSATACNHILDSQPGVHVPQVVLIARGYFQRLLSRSRS